MFCDIYKKNQCPIFLYSIEVIINNLACYLRTGVRVFYALKANYNRFLVAYIANMCGFEVVSVSELRYLLLCGVVDLSNVIFSGVCKSVTDLFFAIRLGVGYLSIDSIAELKLLSSVLSKFQQFSTKFLVRFNLNINVNTSSFIKTCTYRTKFGVCEYQASLFFSLVRYYNIPLYGFSFHLGSQVFEFLPYYIAYNKLVCFVDIYKLPIKVINIGGGFGVDYIRSSIAKWLLDQLLAIVSGRFLVFVEPGRSIVANACVTFSRVVCVKSSYIRNFIVLDVGMDSIIRPALYSSFHKIVVLRLYLVTVNRCDFVGPICESTDVFLNAGFVVLNVGDYVCIYDTGAYCLSMRMNYNLRVRPLEVVF